MVTCASGAKSHGVNSTLGACHRLSMRVKCMEGMEWFDSHIQQLARKDALKVPAGNKRHCGSDQGPGSDGFCPHLLRLKNVYGPPHRDVGFLYTHIRHYGYNLQH